MDPVRTSFPPEGPDGILDSFVNISGERSPYTRAVPNRGPAGDSIDGPTAPKGAAQPATLVNAEVLGPVCRPMTTIMHTDPEGFARGTSKNVKLLPSRTGVSDFWARRS